MKNLKAFAVCILACSLIWLPVLAQESNYIGIILKSNSSVPIKFRGIEVQEMKLFGPEKSLDMLLANPAYTNCNILMSKATSKDFTQVPITSRELKNRSNSSILVELDIPSDFIKLLKEERKKKTELPKDTSNCDPEISVCIGNKEASFSIGCEDGTSIEISTSGRLKLTSKMGNVSIGVDLN